MVITCVCFSFIWSCWPLDLWFIWLYSFTGELCGLIIVHVTVIINLWISVSSYLLKGTWNIKTVVWLHEQSVLTFHSHCLSLEMRQKCLITKTVIAFLTHYNLGWTFLVYVFVRNYWRECLLAVNLRHILILDCLVPLILILSIRGLLP